MDWRGLIRIGEDFDLLGIETPSIHMDWGKTEQALKVPKYLRTKGIKETLGCWTLEQWNCTGRP
jgi:hypothetical protein